MAEREGFEPPVPCGTPDFESGTFDHSATPPLLNNYELLRKMAKPIILTAINVSFNIHAF